MVLICHVTLHGHMSKSLFGFIGQNLVSPHLVILCGHLFSASEDKTTLLKDHLTLCVGVPHCMPPHHQF